MSEINKRKFIERYSKAVNEGYAAIFAGAGLSMSSGYVDWKTLVTPFAEELNLDINNEHDLASVAQYYRNEKRNRTRINQEIIERYSTDKEPNENIKILTRLPIYTFWTTNYDKLLEEGFRLNNKNIDVKVDQHQLTTHRRDRDAVLYKMHGDVNSPSNAVLTKEDYEVYNLKRPLFTTVLQGDLVSKCFLFIGFSFEDPNLDSILSRTRNILGENVGENYWLEKRVQESPDSQESHDEYLIAKTKQKLKINELKRYGIETVLIESYDEITEIFKSIERLNMKRNIFISGSIEKYNNVWDKDKVEKFCFELSKKLIENNYKIYSGFGLGVGSSVINGALEEIYSKKYKQVDEHLILRPFPQNATSKENSNIAWRKYRQEILSNTGVSIFIFGNKNSNGENIPADGIKMEFEIARENNNIIIPIGSTGEMSQVIFEEVKNNIEEYSYLKPYLEILERSFDIETLIETIVKIIENI